MPGVGGTYPNETYPAQLALVLCLFTGAGGAVGGSSLRHSQGFPAAQDPPKNGTLNPHVYAMNIFYTCTHANSKSKTHDPSL
eukprot:scaffold183662_cov12-Tisochrysis_lutea.AAC.1